MGIIKDSLCLLVFAQSDLESVLDDVALAGVENLEVIGLLDVPAAIVPAVLVEHQEILASDLLITVAILCNNLVRKKTQKRLKIISDLFESGHVGPDRFRGTLHVRGAGLPG